MSTKKPKTTYQEESAIIDLVEFPDEVYEAMVPDKSEEEDEIDSEEEDLY